MMKSCQRARQLPPGNRIHCDASLAGGAGVVQKCLADRGSVEGWEQCAPVLPSLQSIPIQQVVKRLPVVVYFITIMDDVEVNAEQPRSKEQQECKLGADCPGTNHFCTALIRLALAGRRLSREMSLTAACTLT